MGEVIYTCNCFLFILGKIGYGTCSEALAYKCPFVFVRRDYFNEEPFLRNMLEVFY
jgi:L-arabinokinase